MNFDVAQRIADAVLYEGYVLYPYRASALKNRLRWQFGVVAPRAYSEYTDIESCFMQTEVMLEAPEDAAVAVRVRCLQIQTRRSETPVPWEEGIPVVIDAGQLGLSDLLRAPADVPIVLPAAPDRAAVTGHLRISATRLEAAVKLCVRIENTTPWMPADGTRREDALRLSLIGTHTLLAVEPGRFVSPVDPPPHLTSAVITCSNRHTWPALIGDRASSNVMLSSPIILADFPAIAPESPADLCDSTEIDELLLLRIMTLTDEEKREARSTDERARRIIDGADSIPREVFERLHGAIRQPQKTDGWVDTDGGRLARGAQVRLVPKRRADSTDFFLKQRKATVAGVYRDLEDRCYVAVTVDDDPAAALHNETGRYFYFDPDEVELIAHEERI